MNPGPLVVLLYIGDEIIPSYMGIIMNHCKDPYQNNQYMLYAGDEILLSYMGIMS